MLMPMSCRALAFVSVLAVAVACGPKGSAGPARGAGGDPALGFVAADAAYVVTAPRVGDAVAVLDDLADAVGMLDAADARLIGAELARELGFDPLSLDSVVAQGIDPGRGIALWGRGDLGPTLALPIADRAPIVARIDAWRARGAVVQVGRIGAHEVSTWRPEREVAIHWSFVDDWLLVHVEFALAHEPAEQWLTQALAARGAVVGTPDFAAARAAAAAQLGDPPALLAMARVPAILGSRLWREVGGCAAPLTSLGRVTLAATTDGAVARGALVLEVPGGVDGIRAMQLAAPPGWRDARGTPPVAVEVALDLRRLQAALAPCIGDELTRDAIRAGVFGGRAFAEQLDLDDREIRAAFAGRVDPRVVTDATDEVPGFDFLARRRTVAGHAVTEIEVPMIPKLGFTAAGEELVAAVGLAIDPILAGATDPGLERAAADLGRVEVRPLAWTAAAWDALLDDLIVRDQARARTIAALRRWQLGVIEAHLDDRAIVITARGERAR